MRRVKAVLHPAKWCVYAHRIDGLTVYIGSGLATRAFDFHRRSKLWKDTVLSAGRIEVHVLSWHDDAASAREAERSKILAHRPKCNVAVPADKPEQQRAAFEQRLHTLVERWAVETERSEP